MSWVYAIVGKCYINTDFIEQIIAESGRGRMMAYYDGKWVVISDTWYEYPPEFSRVGVEEERK